MDFKATSWFERNYKYILTVIVIFVSIGAVFYYFSLQDKSDTFIAASVYALFLFAAGVYMSYMSNEIADKLQDRIEIYLNLQRVYSFFKVNLEKNALDYEATKRAIISFQVFMFFASQNSSLLQNFFPRHRWGIFMLTPIVLTD